MANLGAGVPELCLPVNSLKSTLARSPASVASKQLTKILNYLESTLTKNRGEGAVPLVFQLYGKLGVLSGMENPGSSSTFNWISLATPEDQNHFPEPEEVCVAGAVAGAASLINIGQRGNAKLPDTSSITFTWQT